MSNKEKDNGMEEETALVKDIITRVCGDLRYYLKAAKEDRAPIILIDALISVTAISLEGASLSLVALK